MHPDAAMAVLTTALASCTGRAEETDDPVYARADYAAEFFNTVEDFFRRVVEDPDYAALLGVFGMNLLERTGSRPVKRQTDLSAGPLEITHPSQLRAIPNNAVLQQMGFLANVVGGLGRASAIDLETFAALRQSSPRFGRAIAGAAHAASLSDPDVLAAYVASLDPAFWLDRSARSAAAGDTVMSEELGLVSQRLEPMGLHDRLMKVHRVFFRDFLLLRSALDRDATASAAAVSSEARESLLVLHAIRLALLHRLWRLAMHIPEFSPQLGTTVEDLVHRVMRLDVTDAVARLKQIFPLAPADRGSGEDFGEPASYLADSQRTYGHEHAAIFDPMLKLYGLIRRIGAAVTYHMGAIG
jgi:phosphoenolpyruvate carboxylase